MAIPKAQDCNRHPERSVVTPRPALIEARNPRHRSAQDHEYKIAISPVLSTDIKLQFP
jgi:hypothetical protein